MKLPKKPDELLHLDDGDDLPPEDEACELVLTYGRDYALGLCREELERGSGQDDIDHWTKVTRIIAEQASEEDDRQLALFH